MSIVLKSEELRRYFRNNGVLTEQMAKSIFNKINIELVTTEGGKVSQDLLEDLALIETTYPQLLRHTTIINNTGFAVNLQPIIDILAEYPNLSHDTLKSLTIKSKYDSDYNVNFSKLKKIEKLTLSGGNRVSKFTVDPKKLPTITGTNFELELENFDLTGIDLTSTKVNALTLNGRGTKNFSRIKGLDKLRTFSIVNKDLDREFYDMIDFINSPSSNVSTLVIDSVNLSTERPFEMIKSDKIAQIEIKNSKLNNLEGLKSWYGKLTGLEVYGNALTEKEIPTLMDFIKKYPIAYVDFKENTGIRNFFNSISTESFSEHTRRNIYNSLLTTDGPRDVKNKDILQKLCEDSTIPISITDAEIIRGQAKVTANPIEIPNGVNLSKIDFNKEYLKGGTLLLSQAQIEELRKLGKLPKDMNLAVRITSAKDLDSETIKKLHHEDGIREVVMMNEDGVRNTRVSYSSIDYYHIRNVLDEIVAGIDPKEFDFQKFATVYARVTEFLKYDYSVIDKNTTDGLRLAGRERHNSRNLRNGLLDGKCVCAGYAEILRNALSLVGIKSKYLVGKTFDDPDLKMLHAWNAVELEDENKIKRWYLVDSTWDAGKVLSGKAEYMLLDGETFTKKGHQKYLSYDVPVFADKPYNKNRISIGLEEARKRMVNPREAYMEKRQKKVPTKPEIRREEPKKEKPKKEEPKKEEPKKTPVKGERVKTEEELELIKKRDYVSGEIRGIYDTLDRTLGLDSSSRKRYYQKLAELEKKVNELNEKIAAFEKEDSKSEETEREIKVEKQEKEVPKVTIPTSGAKPQENKNNFGKEMPDVKMKSQEKLEEETKLTTEQIRANNELEDYINENLGKTNLPAVKTREDLIASKKITLQRDAENGFVKFVNNVFKREMKEPPKFISGIIKFAINTRFWAQDIIREIRQKDDKIDDELAAISIVELENNREEKEELVEPVNVLFPRSPRAKKTYAEKTVEKHHKRSSKKDEIDRTR